MSTLDSIRSAVVSRVRELRQARQWTQAELARHLGLSQARLSEIERGGGSFTAEQLLLLLQLFNVSATSFLPKPPADPEALALQNALARLGARHLHESETTPPDPRFDDPAAAIQAALLSADPRFIAALAPVIVEQVDQLNLPRLAAKLDDTGLDRRLAWLLDNVLAALRAELPTLTSRHDTQRYRRAELLLSTYTDAALPSRLDAFATRPPPPDILDRGIRSKQSLTAVANAASALSKKWHIVTAIEPDDFRHALRAARDTD